jgi:hypothetical protein
MALNFGLMEGGGLLNSGQRQVLSISPTEMNSQYPSVDNIYYAGSIYVQRVAAPSGDGFFYVKVILPDKAIITNGIVYGTNTGKDWVLFRSTFAGAAGETIATAKVGTLAKANSLGVIDNSEYNYCLEIVAPNNGDKLFGAQLEYQI